MKILYIARHAKSNWGEVGYSDFDRPLNDEGLNDARGMAKHLLSMDLKVDEIISSGAMRALTTAQFYAEQIHGDLTVVKDDAIYQADERELFQVVSEFSSELNNVMLVGHNPTLSLLVELLTGDLINMSAGSIVEVKLDMDDWSHVSINCASLVQTLLPSHIV